MRRFRIAAMYATISVGVVLGLAEEGMAQTMQFPVDRDAGINGFGGEEWANFGASPSVRAAKGNQHGSIFDWSRDTKDGILEFMAGIEGPIEVTFSIFPQPNSGGPPGADIGVETVESKEDWVEGDDPQGGCCGQTGWTPGTFAMTHTYAQTFLDENGIVDELQSIPWVNDEDDTEYVFMNRTGCPPACAIPNAVNSVKFSLDDYVEDAPWSVVLDDAVVDALLNDEFNVGIRLEGREQHANWKVYMRENGDGSQAAFLSVGPKVCSAERTIAPSFYLPGDVVTVTVAYRNTAPGTTVADTFPGGWSIAEAGDGTVNGSTISFTTGDEPEGQVSYQLTVPPAACETVSFSGTISGDPISEGGQPCDADIGGESEAECIGIHGIAIREDTWHDFTDIDSSGALPNVVETDDGLASLHFPSTDEDMFAIYVVNVTQLPAGKSTFPVAVTARNAGTAAAGLGIRNLSIDNAPPDEQQAYLALFLDGGGNGMAQDESSNQDPPGTIGDIPRENTTTTDTALSEYGLAKTEIAQLELRLGENILRLDGTDPNVLPGYIPQTGAQLFHLVIGPDDPDLQGEIVVACNVKRRVPSYYATNLPLEVTLEARGIAGATTITETYPAGFQVVDAGGGTNDAGSNTLTFNVTESTDIVYSLRSSGCGDVEFSGAFTGAGDFCEGDTSGDTTSQCFGTKTDYRVSQNGAGVQIWFEAEDFAERWDSLGNVEIRGVDEPLEEFAEVRNKAGNIFSSVRRTGNGGGKIVYRFNLDDAGGGAGTWYFWGRVFNPANSSDYVLLDAHPTDDPVNPPDQPVTDDGDDRIFEQNAGGSGFDPPFAWSRDDHAEGHTKMLADGENVMHIYHRQGNNVFWDTFMWTDDPDYIPTDDDYLAADPVGVAETRFVRGDANADGGFNISDGSFILNNLFAGGPDPTCMDAADANSDGTVNIADGVFVLNALFAGAANPAPPFPDCGAADLLIGCDSFVGCQ